MGIGTNNPAAKLEVFGNSKFNGELNLQGINDLNTNNTYELILRDSISGISINLVSEIFCRH